MIKKVTVEAAVGSVLAHDLTKIIPGVYKGTAFKKGHIIRREDVEELRNIGKYHLFVVELTETQLHEAEAARRLGEAVAGGGLTVDSAHEGRVDIRSARRGLLRIDLDGLNRLNQLGQLAVITLHRHTLVEKDQIVASAKIIPLIIPGERIHLAEAIAARYQPVLAVEPLLPLKAGIVITGNEVYYGRIQDGFGEVFKAKLVHYGVELAGIKYAPDDAGAIQEEMAGLLASGAEILFVSGGMAVDADDVTPQAIVNMADEVVAYGVPLMPGAMAMVAYRGDVPIIGVPACAMFHRTTILDLIFPRLLAKERLHPADLAAFGHGGLCLKCETCRYPVCPLGK